MSTRSNPYQRGGFTAIDLVALLAAVFLLIALAGIILPILGGARTTSRPMTNSIQLRGISQGLIVFAQDNKIGGNDGYFPGLDSSGNVIPDGPDTGYSGDGTEPGTRFWILLEGNYFTPEYMINSADTRAIEAEWAITGSHYEPITAEHYSYAMLGIAEALDMTEEGFAPGADTRATEWKETLNTNAAVLSDRAIGTGRSDISSVWTVAGSGDWRGTVAKNDNSTAFETTAEFEDTRYGRAAVNALDHLFEDAPAATDAFLVHEDAVTAYSAN
ncbi:MAG: hypothetical protein AAF333_15645 [Planctomycetota bacterium]